MMHNNKRVLVAMSGGIDSSAVCLMLQEQGYEVVGMTMRVYDLPRQFAEGEIDPDFIRSAPSRTGRSAGHRAPCGRCAQGVSRKHRGLFHRRI